MFIFVFERHICWVLHSWLTGVFSTVCLAALFSPVLFQTCCCSLALSVVFLWLWLTAVCSVTQCLPLCVGPALSLLSFLIVWMNSYIKFHKFPSLLQGFPSGFVYMLLCLMFLHRSLKLCSSLFNLLSLSLRLDKLCFQFHWCFLLPAQNYCWTTLEIFFISAIVLFNSRISISLWVISICIFTVTLLSPLNFLSFCELIVQCLWYSVPISFSFSWVWVTLHCFLCLIIFLCEN